MNPDDIAPHWSPWRSISLAILGTVLVAWECFVRPLDGRLLPGNVFMGAGWLLCLFALRKAYLARRHAPARTSMHTTAVVVGVAGVFSPLVALVVLLVLWRMNPSSLGRVFRGAAGKTLVARPGASRAWVVSPLDRAAATAADCRAPERRLTTHRGGSAWLRDAGAEHASVAAFARLSLRLLAAGAPPNLLAWTHQAALDEIEHARRCYMLATCGGDSPCGPEPFGAAMGADPWADKPPHELIASLAAETLLDGCLLEGVAARVAEKELERCRLSGADPYEIATLAIIARDEENHAELAWAIVAWCLAVRPTHARAALVLAQKHLHQGPSVVQAMLDGSSRREAQQLQGIFMGVRAEAVSRLSQLLESGSNGAHRERVAKISDQL